MYQICISVNCFVILNNDALIQNIVGRLSLCILPRSLFIDSWLIRPPGSTSIEEAGFFRVGPLRCDGKRTNTTGSTDDDWFYWSRNTFSRTYINVRLKKSMAISYVAHT